MFFILRSRELHNMRYWYLTDVSLKAFWLKLKYDLLVFLGYCSDVLVENASSSFSSSYADQLI